jgi:hypothetical protein
VVFITPTNFTIYNERHLYPSCNITNHLSEDEFLERERQFSRASLISDLVGFRGGSSNDRECELIQFMGDICQAARSECPEPGEIEQNERERMLLKKEREVIMKQASEMRKEVKELHDQINLLERKGLAQPRERFAIVDLIGQSCNMSSLLQNAVQYCETHDGCPFHVLGCDSTVAASCGSIWIKMGSPCSKLAGKLKQAMKTPARI